jgi:hypothetical protein
MRIAKHSIAAAVVLLIASTRLAFAAKPHVITFGKWISVKLLSSSEESKPLESKVRPLLIDGKLREYTVGIPHEVTDRLFVVRRVVRVNDTLPAETAPNAHWIWQRAGWLAIDRETGHISAMILPDFDPDSSSASWYRDYIAYCGVSDDGRKLLAIVAQIGRRKPILRKEIEQVKGVADPAQECSSPIWQRSPPRVTFAAPSDQKFTFAIHGHLVETVISEEDEASAD